MKAQKVFENIEFERGSDPKKSLEIGVHTPEAREKRRLERYKSLDQDFKREFGDFMFDTGSHGGFYTEWQTRGGDSGISTRDSIRVHWTDPYTKKEIKEWFKENHPYFTLKSLKMGLSGPNMKAPYLYIEYNDII